jgi:hypothetical protein
MRNRTEKIHFHLKPGSQKDILLFNNTNYSPVHSRRLKPPCASCGSPPSLGGGLFIQGEYENLFIVGYHEFIRHRFTPFTIVLLWWIVGYQESIRHRFTPLCSCGGL